MMGNTAPFMVMETLIRSSGMPSNNRFMSSTLSMATPAFPTSPDTLGWSLSYPRWVARSNATLSPFCPSAKFFR